MTAAQLSDLERRLASPVALERVYGVRMGQGGAPRVLRRRARYHFGELVIPWTPPHLRFIYTVVDESETGWPPRALARNLGETIHYGGLGLRAIETISPDGVPLERVMRQLLDDNGLRDVPLETPIPSCFLVLPYVVAGVSVRQALETLAALVGWRVRFDAKGAGLVAAPPVANIPAASTASLLTH